MRATQVAFLLVALVGAPSQAQLGIPPLLPSTGPVISRTADAVGTGLSGKTNEIGRQLEQVRLERIDVLLRANHDTIERDINGAPARRGELLVVDPAPDVLAQLNRAGFELAEQRLLAGLGMTITRLNIPKGMSLVKAQQLVARLTPSSEVTADQLHFASGASGKIALPRERSLVAAPISEPVGFIDGAPGSATPVAAIQSFAFGDARASNHGSAVASLLSQAGVRWIYAADVYGSDPAGGGAFAIARALDWLVGQKVRVVSVSLVGPNNPVLARAIIAARSRGTTIVAAVGNDGPAAPPSYPASYPGVLAVTGVDGRNRALIEAGRALHLDYAAPGADMLAANAVGRMVKVRGTSFAAPLVAARAAAALQTIGGPAIVSILDREARDLGKRGPDSIFGRGLLCSECKIKHRITALCDFFTVHG